MEIIAELKYISTSWGSLRKHLINLTKSENFDTFEFTGRDRQEVEFL